MKKVQLSLQVAREMYNSNVESLKAFALENYTEEELTKPILPKTWEEITRLEGAYISTVSVIENFEANTAKNNRNIYPTTLLAEAALVNTQLLYLRDIYRQGWVPDWENTSHNKYCIFLYKNKWVIGVNIYNHTSFSFQSEEIRDEFYENFKEMLEQVKPLYS